MASPNLGAADRLTGAMSPDRMPLSSAAGIRGQLLKFQTENNTQSTDCIRSYLPQGSIQSNALTNPGSQLTWLLPRGNKDVHWLDDAWWVVKVQLAGGASPANDLTLQPSTSLVNRFEVYVNGTLLDTQYPSQTYYVQRILAETLDENLGAEGDMIGFNEATTLPNTVIAANGGTATLWIPLRGLFSRDAGGYPLGVRPQDEVKIICYPESNRFTYAGVPGATTLNVTDWQLRLIGRAWQDPADLASLQRQFSGDFVKRWYTAPAPQVLSVGAPVASAEVKALMTQRDELLSHMWLQVSPNGTVPNDNIGTQLMGVQFYDQAGMRVLYTDMLEDRFVRSFLEPKHYDGRFMVDASAGQNSNKYHYLIAFSTESQKAMQEGVNYGCYRTSGSDNLAFYPLTNFTGNEVVRITPYYLRQCRFLGSGGAVLDQVAN